jgi:signal transduction histidine kinase/Na+/proline symporter
MTTLPAWLVMAVLAAYAVLLLLAGRLGERRERPDGADFAGTGGQRNGPGRRRGHPLRYSLSLATFASAWAYFGAVGLASAGSWLFLAIALAPILALTVGYPLWRRMAMLARQENVGSLADFLAARYGKSALLGRLCAVVAVLGTLPYMALQFDVLHRAWTYAVGPAPFRQSFWGGDTLLAVAVIAAIALALGARRPSLHQQNPALVTVLSIEAGVKLIALVCAAAFALWLIGSGGGHGPHPLATARPGPAQPVTTLYFPTMLFLCMAGAFTLPRQFHVGFVTLDRIDDIRTARWAVPCYFGVWVLASIAVAVAIQGDGALAAFEPPVRMLGLAERHGPPALVLLLLLGGLSAGAGMVVVELCAISAMITNELVLPALRWLRGGRAAPADAGVWILWSRRAAIVLLAMLAWAADRFLGGRVAVDDLGQVSLAAFAQFLPALIGGIYWRRGHADGALAGIGAGATLWLITSAAPLLMSASGNGPRNWGQAAGAPELAILLSLSVNLLLYVVFSLLARPRPVDTIQANAFVGGPAPAPQRPPGRIDATLADIERLLARFIGPDEAARALFGLRTSTPDGRAEDAPVTPTQLRMVEKLLAGVIGAPSARNVINIALPAKRQSAGEIDRILDEAAHAVHFSRDLLHNALQGLNEGVSMVDRDLRLIAWNARYIQMLNLSLADIYVGKPLSDLLLERSDSAGISAIRSNLLGLNGSVARGEALEEEWRLEDGRILQVIGKPLTRGEYLSTLTDITSLREAERVLAQDKEALELRVEQRTAELVEARHAAELATAAQKRFVAAASHDLVQPLHAARLFIASVRDGAGVAPAHTELLRRAEESVDGAHRLMRALLNLSRLETTSLRPTLSAVALDPIFASLCEEFADQAESRGLRFVIRPTDHMVTSDADLLKSVLQNLVSNAIRYTPRGTVLVAARPAGRDVRIEVRDSGIGIDAGMLDTAFGEYRRLPAADELAEGSGLGLSIVARIARALGHPVAVRSVPGSGSVFSVLLRSAGYPAGDVLADPADVHPPELVPEILADLAADAAAGAGESGLAGMTVLCIDDEPDVLAGMQALLAGWGALPVLASSGADLPAADGHGDTGWDAIIADHLLPGESGLAILRRLAGRAPVRILLTATAEDSWDAELPREGIMLMRKPLVPPQLRAMLARHSDQPPGRSATIETR